MKRGAFATEVQKLAAIYLAGGTLTGHTGTTPQTPKKETPPKRA
jgi:hypothetical protein